jgi:signal transduction histidine kinase
MNLLLNAIQAIQGGGGRSGDGAVEIFLAADGFTVSDNGPGIPPALVPHLFEPFTSDKPAGTGLGLHLARAIAQAHGARLEYRPRAGGGACFVFSGLPAAAPPPPA